MYQMMIPYVSATAGALVTALGLNHVAKYAPPLLGRFVPFVAVAAANCINVPLVRQDELINGIQVGLIILMLKIQLFLENT